MTTHNTPDKQGEALELFRRSVGFQFGFVMYSGLDVKTAVDHICAAAEVLFAARRASVAAVEGDALRNLLARFLWDKYGCTIEHHRMKVLKHFVEWAESAAASSSAPAEPPDDTQTLARLDRQFIAGVKYGQNAEYRQAQDTIRARYEDIHATTRDNAAPAEPLQPTGEQEK